MVSLRTLGEIVAALATVGFLTAVIGLFWYLYYSATNRVAPAVSVYLLFGGMVLFIISAAVVNEISKKTKYKKAGV
jgi:hypothetical protein